VTNDTRSKDNTLQLVLIGALAGLAITGLVFLVRYLAKAHEIDSATEIIDDCRDRIESLEHRLDERLASRMMVR